MKYFFFSFLIAAFCCVQVNAQGKYAGVFKNLIGAKYSNETEVKVFESYPLHEGSIISDINDLNVMVLDVYRKGSAAIVVFGLKTDSPREQYKIADIIEIKKIPKGYEINTTSCKEGETEGQILIALVKTKQGKYAGPVKVAWLCNRDKLRFETINTKLIKCFNEEGD